MKKYISILLILIFCMAAPAGASGDNTEYQLLESLGVLPESFAMQENIRRGDFAVIAAKLYFDELQAADTAVSPFADVDSSSACFAAVYTLKNLNIVKGDGTYFYPERPVTLNEALTIIVKCIGYEQYAQSKGGYPGGYLAAAYDSGTLDNVSLTDEYISGENAVKMFYNSLFAESVLFESAGDYGVTYERTQEKILSSALGLEEFEGILIDDGMLSYDNSGYKENGAMRLRLSDGKEIRLFSDGAYTYGSFACKVKVYAKYDDTKDMYRIVFLKNTKAVTRTAVESRKIILSDMSYVEYEESEDSERSTKITFSAEAPYVFINGKRVASVTAEELKPTDGFVEYIDNNGDKKADVILVWDFNSRVIVQSVSTKQIQCMVNPVNNLNLDDETKVYRFIGTDGLLTADRIQAGNTLSVAQTEGRLGGQELCFVYVSTRTARGPIQSVYDGDKVAVGEEIYRISPSALQKPNFLSGLKIGENSVFYLDYFGNVVHYGKMSGSAVSYFYIIDLEVEDSFGEEEVTLRAYTPNAVFSDFKISDKAIIDGSTLDGKLRDGTTAAKGEEISELLCVRPDGTVDYPTSSEASACNRALTRIVSRPAIYKVNADKVITYIDTDAPTYTDTQREENDPYTLKAGSRFPKDTNYQERYKTFNGKFFLDQSSVILKVADVDRYGLPSNTNTTFINLYEEDISDISNYYVMGTGDLNRNTSYDIQAYNIDPDTGVAAFAVIRGKTERAYTHNDYGNGLKVFEKLTEYYDEQTSRYIYKLYYKQGDTTQTAIVDPDSISTFCGNILFGGTYPAADGSDITVEKLAAGDIIYVNVTDGNLTHISRELDLSKINQKSTSGYLSAGPYNPYYTTSGGATNLPVPFDQRYLFNHSDYSSTYIMDLAVPYSVSGNIMTIMKPVLAGTTTYTTWGAYLAAPDTAGLSRKFINWTTASITVVEETKHAADGGCEFRIRTGDVSDIKFLSAYGSTEEGICQASKIFTYDEQGTVEDIIILNLSEEHNHGN